MKSFFLSFFCLSLVFHAPAQSLNLLKRANMPKAVDETSGLEIGANGGYWTHNDSGDDPILYRFNNLGNVDKTVVIRDVSNIDWEDLAQDDQGNFYVGDFGNNANLRTDLRIYKIPNPDLVVTDTVDAEVIEIAYADQLAFPPLQPFQNYDAEAFFWHNQELYIFSKNRTSPFTGYTYLYRFPDTAGTYSSAPTDSFFTGIGTDFLFWITAADVSPDRRHMALLSSDKMWLFNCYSGDDFLGGGVWQISLGAISQKEAICFADDSTFLVTDEKQTIGPLVLGGAFYEASISHFRDRLRLDLGGDIAATGDSVVLDAGFPGATYLWSTGQTSQQITVRKGGTYQVEVNFNGCSAIDSIGVDFGTNSLSDGQSSTFQVQLSPNPFSSYTDLTCHLSSPGPVQIEIFDMQGKRVSRFSFPLEAAGKQVYRLTQQNLNIRPGNYILAVTHNGHRVEKRFVRE